MACDCDPLEPADSCPPYASLASVERIITRLSGCCIGDVPLGTAEVSFLTTGFPGGVPCECDVLWIRRDTSEWFVSLDGGANWCAFCVSCTAVVAAGTDPADFCNDGWGGAVPQSCDLVWVVYDDGSGAWVGPSAQVCGDPTLWCNLCYGKFSGAQIGFTVVATGLPLVATPNGTFALAAFNVVNYDTDGYFNPANPGRLVAPFDGYYDISGCWAVNPPAVGNDTGSAGAMVMLNGNIATYDTRQVWGGLYDPAHTGDSIYAHSGTRTVYMTAGEYIELYRSYDKDTENDGVWPQGHSQNWLQMTYRGA